MKKWFSLAYLIPIVISMSFGLFCTFLMVNPTEQISQIILPLAPLPEEGLNPWGNSLYFLFLIGVIGTLMASLLKKGKVAVVRLVTGVALSVVIFLLSYTYGSALLSKLTIPYSAFSILTLTFFLSFLVTVILFKSNNHLYRVAVLCLGGAIGSFMGVSIPTVSMFLILCLISIYDLFAVYRGPVGKMVTYGVENLRGLSFDFKGVQIGLGDLVFYSMLCGHLLLNFGILSSLGSLVGILFGALITLKLLEFQKIFPGLPFPIFLGLIGGFFPLLF